MKIQKIQALIKCYVFLIQKFECTGHSPVQIYLIRIGDLCLTGLQLFVRVPPQNTPDLFYGQMSSRKASKRGLQLEDDNHDGDNDDDDEPAKPLTWC